MNFGMAENQYLALLSRVINDGVYKMDRTGVGCRSLFGEQIQFEITEQFPLLTTKKIHWKSVVHELLWFLSGDTNIKYLQDNGVRIWDDWADENGDLGPVYGKQWRDFGATQFHGGVDQIKWVENEIKTNPSSRRLVVSAWNPKDVNKMALPPCHCLFQFHVRGEFLDCQLYQRSADIFIGSPFNIASYSLLTYMMAKATGLQPGMFTYTLGDVHLYENHIDQAYEQLSRDKLAPPRVELAEKDSVLSYTFDDVKLIDYVSHAAIKAPIAV
jgi:thymidylate synthase